MKVVVIGLGNQGKKRAEIAGSDVVTTVDPFNAEAVYRTIEEVNSADYEAALVCTPDNPKPDLLAYLLERGKHILVEKPLLGNARYSLKRLRSLANENHRVCYTAYNHRFEPHILRVKSILAEGWLGKLFHVNFFYGNGTAREVKNSPWRDNGLGVLSDLGCHLLDWTLQLFGPPLGPIKFCAAQRFENRTFDHFQFSFDGETLFNYEMSLLSWRNTFRFDLFAENGSLHIDGLCKWGPSILTIRRRVLPSGRPLEEAQTVVCPDPTWKCEYDHFVNLCNHPASNLENDIWIESKLHDLGMRATR